MKASNHEYKFKAGLQSQIRRHPLARARNARQPDPDRHLVRHRRQMGLVDGLGAVSHIHHLVSSLRDPDPAGQS